VRVQVPPSAPHLKRAHEDLEARTVGGLPLEAFLCYICTMADISELTRLPIEQRLKLIEELWDSIDADDDTLPLPEWQRTELDARIDALEHGTSTGANWDEVRRRITDPS
jgi:putative addiction module component (TIGR02574 family)